MAHSKDYQVENERPDSRTGVVQGKDKPMDCSDQVNQENCQIIKQLCEVTGATFDQAFNAFNAANGNVENALAFMTNPQQITDRTTQKGMQTSVLKNSQTSKDDVIDLTKDKDERDEDLEKAIALSLQESHSAPQGITAEEQDISRILEASLIENKSGLKRKRADPWMAFVDPVNPHERKRDDTTPVGFKNVGNTCWFSSVIQSLFHVPVFRKLVLHCTLPEVTEKEQKDVPRIAFMQELRKIFALLIGSKRKYVDPTRAVEILKEALQYNGSESNPGNQQDVSEFTHKLLEWLEETFKVEAAGNQEDNINPVMDLFFGQSKVEGVYEGKQFSNLEMFGAYPIQVQGYGNLHDSLEGGMARGEIEPANNVHTHKSDQEHWFTRLPAVLKFMLSRFLFNQNTGRAEKIHERFFFDRTIYMDRYLEKNKDITRIRREEVKKLKERHHLLRNSLDSYTSYGTGVRHSHVQDVLNSSLKFVQSTEPTSDNGCSDVEMKPSIPDSPRSHKILSEEWKLRPAPRYISHTERQTIESCLRRWKTEVEQDVEVISKSLKEVEESISIMYDDEEMKKVPYRLHAVLVHEGQASGGHYWAYIYNHIDNQWRKFNDITVSQVTWDEVERESLGGYRHVSAYGLMYVDASRELQVLARDTPDDLPVYLQRMVDEDNMNFEKEMVEWDDKLAASAKASPDDKSKVPATTSRPDLVLDAEASCAVSPHDHNPITETSSLRDIDNYLNKTCASEKLQLEKMASEHPVGGLRDLRLEYIGHYLIQCGAPQYVIEWIILKHMVDETKSLDDRCLRVKRRAIELLNKQDPEKTEELKKWRDKYKVFQRVNSCFLTGLEHLHNHKYQEALPYLVHAYTLNHKLEDANYPSQSMDEKLLAFCRRRCFLELNQHAISLFEAQDHSTLSEGLDLVSELVVPCIPALFTSAHAEDREAVEQIRNKWFTYLGGSMLDDQRREKLQDFLPKLLDVTSEGHQEIGPPPVLRPANSRDLCERFTKAMELVHANMAFTVKA